MVRSCRISCKLDSNTRSRILVTLTTVYQEQLFVEWNGHNLYPHERKDSSVEEIQLSKNNSEKVYEESKL